MRPPVQNIPRIISDERQKKKSGFTSWECLVLFTLSAVCLLCYLSRVWYEQVSEEKKHGISTMEDPEIAIPYLHLLRPTNTTQQQWTSSLGEWLQSAFYSRHVLDSSTVCTATNTPVLCASCKKIPKRQVWMNFNPFPAASLLVWKVYEVCSLKSILAH